LSRNSIEVEPEEIVVVVVVVTQQMRSQEQQLLSLSSRDRFAAYGWKYSSTG
jgi:hypothetical protein